MYEPIILNLEQTGFEGFYRFSLEINPTPFQTRSERHASKTLRHYKLFVLDRHTLN
jgi:hypothetical protein